MAIVPKKHEMPTQEPAVRARNFREVALGYDEETAVAEALRCLNCKNRPCVTGCPVNIRIPDFIAKMKERDFEGAYDVITESSSLPAVCGRVCPQESQCESKCTLGIKFEPVGIGRLERFVADRHNEKADAEIKVPEQNGHRVAIVGSGPSGLTCAGDLAKKGYKVTVFEALHTAGGVLVYGIPEFRLPKRIVAKEVETLKKDANYYFLLIVTGQFCGEMEPGIDFISLVKGGPEAEEGIGKMTEVVSIPFSVPGGTGREIAMIPAFLDIIQDFALKAMERDLEGYQGLSLYNRNLPKIRHRNVLFTESDLSFRVSPLDKSGSRTRIVEEDDADDAMIDGTAGTIVSYTVAPEDPSATSRCYKMLIGTDDHTLYYFKRHRITGKTGRGFTAKEFKSISRQAQ